MNKKIKPTHIFMKLFLITILFNGVSFIVQSQDNENKNDWANRSLTGKPKDPSKREIPFATSRPIYRLKDGTLKVYDDPNYMEPEDEFHSGFVNVNFPITSHKRGQLERSDKDKDSFQILSTRIENTDLFTSRPLHIKNPNFLVFVHGYNNGFKDSVLQTAQLSEDLNWGKTDDRPIIAYSWLSRGFTLAYLNDRTFLKREGLRLYEYLKMLIEKHPNAAINVLAHSMGNEVTLRALTHLHEEYAKRGEANKKLFRNVILAAPDVAVEDFYEFMPFVIPNAQRVTHYFSTLDIPIKLSPYANWKKKRAGGQAIYFKGLDSIDTDSVNSKEVGLGHSYFASSEPILNDIQTMLEDAFDLKLSPEDRLNRGWQRVNSIEGSYWLVK